MGLWGQSARNRGFAQGFEYGFGVLGPVQIQTWLLNSIENPNADPHQVLVSGEMQIRIWAWALGPGGRISPGRLFAPAINKCICGVYVGGRFRRCLWGGGFGSRLGRARRFR